MGAAIDEVFTSTPITHEAGDSEHGYYWTSTSANFTSGQLYYYAWYVALGRAGSWPSCSCWATQRCGSIPSRCVASLGVPVTGGAASR